MTVKKEKKSLEFPLNLQNENEFPLKVNFEIYEKISEYWEEQEVYLKLQKTFQQQKTKVFEILDGPIYANGPIHLGHVLNHTLKDIIVRSKTSFGYYSPFRMGWDTHGLPIEHKVLQSYQGERNPVSIREVCKNFALEQVSLQKEVLKRIGKLTDFNDSYLTLNKNYEYWQIKLFEDLVKKNSFFKIFVLFIGLVHIKQFWRKAK